ncbi:MAG: hypothetical protein MJY75_03190 [Bacteroidaceae bacterium]|nr:hypothetical protein [Bacteroidaceae bacterium]
MTTIRMKIVYFHGFGSSGASGTVESLRRLLPDFEIVAPDIPVDPAEALPYLKEFVQQQQPDLIIGTSMGAMYAQQMFGFRKILVNPAFNMSTMSKVMKAGKKYPFQNGRKDGAKDFMITGQIVKNFNQMERQQFKGITGFDLENTWGLFGTHDTSVNCYDLFRKHYSNAQRFEGEHSLNDKSLRQAVLPLVRQILHVI